MYDILIVGSGIIGTFIAEKLMTQDLRIGLIEAGNMEGCLYDMKYVETGQKEKIKIVNAYQFGGGHNVWHGLLARQSNSEIEESEKFWGLTKEEFSNYYDSAEEYLGLKPSERDKIKTTIERKLRLNNLNNLDTKIFYQPDLCFSKKTMYKRLTENNIKIYLDEKVEKINQYLEKYYVIETNNGIKLFTKVIVLAANPIQNIAIISNSFDE
jgi:UDP-galactopyranose mutase